MKSNKKTLTLQRRSLDQKIRSEPLQSIAVPRKGWLKGIREALMMTSEQLAERMGIVQAGVMNMEKRELKKTVSLNMLERAATAMNCRLVYAVIPISGSLEKTIDDQSLFAAKKIAKPIMHSMNLENQSVLPPETRLQIQEMAQELKLKGDRRIWSSTQKKRPIKK